MTHHAFIDESARAGRYLLTAALVPSYELAAITRGVRDQFPKGNRRTHLSAESPAQRRRLLKGFAALPVDSYVVVSAWAGDDDQAVRERCLAAILARTTTWRVAMLVLDSRGQHRDRRDRQFIAREIREARAPEHLLYTHRGSRDEPLLSLPDAVGWAVGAGGRWRELIAPIVAEVVELDP